MHQDNCKASGDIQWSRSSISYSCTVFKRGAAILAKDPMIRSGRSRSKEKQTGTLASVISSSITCGLTVSTKNTRSLYDLRDTPHCKRCDSEGPRLIEFRTTNNQTYYLCPACVEQEDKREMRFSPSWKRSRRPMTILTVPS